MLRKKQMLKIEGYFEAFVLLFLVFIFLYMISDYLMSILLASSLVFLVYRLYRFLLLAIKSEVLCSLFMLFLVISLIILPLYMFSVSLVFEIYALVENNWGFFANFSLQNCSNPVCNIIETNYSFFDKNFEVFLLNLGSFFSSSLGSIFSSIASFVLNLVVFALAFFFMLKDGNKFLVKLRRIIPMKNSYKEALFLKFRDVTEAVFIDSILVAIFQGFLVGIGLYFAGIESFLFWGLMASFLALLPLIGAGVVWIPASIYAYFAINSYTAIGLFLYGLLIVSTSDNLIRPLLMKGKAKAHEFLIFLSILGGMNLFGFFGLFLGPIIVSLLISVLQLYNLEFE